MGVINMHEPEKWGYVYFSSKQAGEKEVFNIPEDEKIKWTLFEYYRAQKSYFKTHEKWATTIDDLKLDNIKENTIIPILENHSNGWNITVNSPFSKQQLIIDEDGTFIKK